MKKFLQACKSKPPILWVLLVMLFLVSTAICIAVIGMSADYTVLRIYLCMLFPVFHLWIFSAPLGRYETWHLVFTYAYVSDLFVYAIRGATWGDLAVWLCIGAGALLGGLFLLTLWRALWAHDRCQI